MTSSFTTATDRATNRAPDGTADGAAPATTDAATRTATRTATETATRTATETATEAATGAAAPEAVQALRRAWLAVLARAGRAELEEALRTHAPGVRFDHLRRPERGMVMLRGRMGGTGDAFNFGEATVSRCTVRLADGLVGCGHVLGRDLRRAELVAVFDALLQEPTYRAELQGRVLEPLRERQQAARLAAARAAGASRVEFFTLVRGQ